MPLIKRKFRKDLDKEEMEPSKEEHSLAVAFDAQRSAKKMSHGGMVHPDMMDDDEDEKEMDLVDRIMAKKMAKGGMVEQEAAEHLQKQGMEQPNQYYEANEEALDWHMGDDLAEVGEDEGSVEDAFDHIDKMISRMHKRKQS